MAPFLRSGPTCFTGLCLAAEAIDDASVRRLVATHPPHTAPTYGAILEAWRGAREAESTQPPQEAETT